MLDALWSLTADVIRVGWNVDEPAAELRLTPSPVEAIRLVGSHRAPVPTGRAQVIEAPTSLVPDKVARLAAFEKLRVITFRVGGYVGGAS